MSAENQRKKEFTITAKIGDREFALNGFQSPRGLKHEGKRPNIVIIDYHQELNRVELLRFAEYLYTIARSMEFE